MELLKALLFALLLAAASLASGQGQGIGIVVMHGKGGQPGAPHIMDFVEQLERRGFLVANLEMPWSRNRNYDVPTSRGEEEVASAAAELRAKGARKVFLAGHSQGGGFALHVGGKPGLDGIIALAPGGNVAGPVYRSKVADALARARKRVAEGKGNEPERLADYEAARGLYPIVSVPAAYVTWFDPDGAMNISRAVRAMDPKTPVLFVVPTNDYPGLIKAAPRLFGDLPKNPLTKFHEPGSDHLHAPSASVDEIVRWTGAVAAAKP